MAFDFRSTQSCEPIQCYLAAGMQLILFVANSIHVNESFANIKDKRNSSMEQQFNGIVYVVCVCNFIVEFGNVTLSFAFLLRIIKPFSRTVC